MRPEQHGNQEGWGSRTSRWKVGLETPLQGRLWRETRLIFAPPLWYDILTWGCIVVGGLIFLSFCVPVIDMIMTPVGFLKQLWLGPALVLAGLWGQLSNERMTVDLKNKSYARREGQGLFKRVIKGRVSDIDAVVATTEIYPIPSGVGQTVIYRVVLHWKGHQHPPLAVAIQTVNLSLGAPLNSAAGKILAEGASHARMMGVPFYDNTYFVGGGPIRPI